jgi:hypothetical protein
LWDDVCDPDGIIFLKKMLELTNTRAEPNAQRRPVGFEADSNVHASMTPTIRGSREKYVLGEYLTPKSIA